MEKEKYYRHSLLMLSDIIYEKEKELTKKQCEVISECFQILTKENVTKDDFENIDNKLQEVDLDWMDTKQNQVIGGALVGMYEVSKYQNNIYD